MAWRDLLRSATVDARQRITRNSCRTSVVKRIDLTVLIATRNGEHVLPRTLNGYRRLAVPSVGWKLLVVDNASTDATPDIVGSYKQDLPLDLLRQPVPGKSRALNTGLAAVEGRLVVLADDDAVPAPGFLDAWAEYLERKGCYGLFGGSIEPLFEVPPPKWLIENLVEVRYDVRRAGFAGRSDRSGRNIWTQHGRSHLGP